MSYTGRPRRDRSAARIGRHVGALEHDGAHVGVARDEPVGGREELALGGGDIERRPVAEKGPREFAVGVDAHHRRFRVRADREQVRAR